MSNATLRTIFRWIHIICGIPIIGYVYSPFDALPDFAWMIRYIFLPILLLSGLWLWKGHLLTKAMRQAG
jgi:uncharacterized membrane protein YkvA (DUF1232 family)